MKKKFIISLIVGVAFSFVALYFAFKHVPLEDLLHSLRNLEYGWFLPAFVVVILAYIIRVVRWQIILSTEKKIPFWDLYHPLMIGFMLNCIIPARIGEAVRPILLKKNHGVPFSTGVATVVAERVFDLVILIVMLVGVLYYVEIDPNFTMSFGEYTLNRDTLATIGQGMAKVSLLLVLAIIGISIDRIRNLVKKILVQLPQYMSFLSERQREFLAEKVVTVLVDIIDGVAAGFGLIKHPLKIVFCLLLTICIWACAAMSFQLLAFGMEGVALSFAEYLAIMAIICFFIALPSVPGFWGLWEAGGVFAFTLFGVSAQNGAGLTLVNHVVQLFPVVLFGLVSVFVAGVNLRQTIRESDTEQVKK